MNVDFDLAEDLARWEAGELTLDDVARRNPDGDIAGLVEVHTWLSLNVADAVHEPGPDWSTLAARLDDRTEADLATVEASTVVLADEPSVSVAAAPSRGYCDDLVPRRAGRWSSRLVATVVAAVVATPTTALAMQMDVVDEAVARVTRPIVDLVRPATPWGSASWGAFGSAAAMVDVDTGQDAAAPVVHVQPAPAPVPPSSSEVVAAPSVEPVVPGYEQVHEQLDEPPGVPAAPTIFSPAPRATVPAPPLTPPADVVDPGGSDDANDPDATTPPADAPAPHPGNGNGPGHGNEPGNGNGPPAVESGGGPGGGHGRGRPDGVGRSPVMNGGPPVFSVAATGATADNVPVSPPAHGREGRPDKAERPERGAANGRSNAARA